jgi:hypothetical protein
MAPPVPVFRADHPFLFAIRDRRSDLVLRARGRSDSGQLMRKQDAKSRNRHRAAQRVLELAAPCALLWLASCASTATSDTIDYAIGSAVLSISARAERGATRDELFITVNGVDVARGSFGPAEAAGTVLRGSYDDVPIEAHCGHRWRPGIHIGHRCSVYVNGEGPVRLDF